MDNDAQSESFLLILRKRLLYFQSQQKFKEEQSFPWGACLFICGSSDREARRLSEARGGGGGGSDNVAFVLGATAAVLLRFGSPNKNITQEERRIEESFVRK